MRTSRDSLLTDMRHASGWYAMLPPPAPANRLEPGVFASLGYAGIGVPRGTISGKLLAEHALGGESDLIRDVQALSGPKPLPPKSLLSIGVSARIWWWRHRARAECQTGVASGGSAGRTTSRGRSADSGSPPA